MVRHYKKKRLEEKWTDENMVAAVEAVRQARMTVRGAVRQFYVPKTSLLHHLSGKVSVIARVGRPTVLKKKKMKYM